MAPFKSTQSFSVGHFLKSFRNRDAIGATALNSPVIPDRRNAIEATGGDGTATPGNGYKYHFFTTPGIFTVASGTGGDIDVLLVGGGGAGTDTDSTYAGGGGGAGGFVERTASVSTGTYPISIGSGGQRNFPGSNTTAFSLVAAGGGKGGRNLPNVNPQNWTADPGGSGGGGAGGAAQKDDGGVVTTVVGNDPPLDPPQGNPGGNGSPGGGGGGGGGGAGSTGNSYDGNSNSPTYGGGHGGLGKAAFNGDTGIPASYGASHPQLAGRWFAGGGGAGTWSNSYGGVGGHQGGVGGGGTGAFGPSVSSQGVDGTGGGGGGSSVAANGSDGGDGIVIIRYPYTA